MKKVVLPVVLYGFVFAFCIPHSALQVSVSPTDVSASSSYDFRELTDAELADITGTGFFADACRHVIMTAAANKARGLPEAVQETIILGALIIAENVCEI